MLTKSHYAKFLMLTKVISYTVLHVSLLILTTIINTIQICQHSVLNLLRVMQDWWVAPIALKAGWSSASTTPGSLSVGMPPGTMLMLKSSAGRLVTQIPEKLLQSQLRRLVSEWE